MSRHVFKVSDRTHQGARFTCALCGARIHVTALQWRRWVADVSIGRCSCGSESFEDAAPDPEEASP